jgi:hypothetical protein
VPGDLDLDGIPDPLDVDDDGDLILDELDRSRTGSRRKPAVGGASNLTLELYQAVNANAAGITGSQLDAALAGSGNLDLGSVGVQGDAGTEVELDCGHPNTGLVYCRRKASRGQKMLFGTPLFGVPFPPAVTPTVMGADAQSQPSRKMSSASSPSP